MAKHIDPIVRRQQILDFLNKNGEATCREICNAIGLSKGPVTGLIRAMRTNNELTRREERDKRASIPYYAAATKVAKSNDRPNTFGFPTTLYRASDREIDRPIPNQGGQGSCRPRTATYLELAG